MPPDSALLLPPCADLRLRAVRCWVVRAQQQSGRTGRTDAAAGSAATRTHEEAAAQCDEPRAGTCSRQRALQCCTLLSALTDAVAHGGRMVVDGCTCAGIFVVGLFLLFLSFVGAFSAWKEIRIGLGLVRSNRQEQERDTASAARRNAVQRRRSNGNDAPELPRRWRRGPDATASSLECAVSPACACCVWIRVRACVRACVRVLVFLLHFDHHRDSVCGRNRRVREAQPGRRVHH